MTDVFRCFLDARGIPVSFRRCLPGAQGHTDNLGDEPGEMGNNLTAVDIGSSAKAVAAGCYFTCALTEDGSVMCW